MTQPQGGAGGVALDPVRLGLVRGGGQPLPLPLRRQMEAAFRADFSAVRIHTGPQAGRIGAIAFATGNDLYFAPGRYQPESMQGQELIGHELAHVVQQRQGRVRPQGSGVSLLQDHALEAEADRLGMRAARQMEARGPDVAPALHGGQHAPLVGLVSGALRFATGTGRALQPRTANASLVIQRKTALSFNPADDKAGTMMIAQVAHQRELHNGTQRKLAAYLSGYLDVPAGLICNHHVPYSAIRSAVEAKLTGAVNLEAAVTWMNQLSLPKDEVYDWTNWGWNDPRDSRFQVGAMPKPNIPATKTIGGTKFYAESKLNTEVNDLIWNLANDPRNLFYWPDTTGDGGGTIVDYPKGAGNMNIKHVQDRLKLYRQGLTALLGVAF